MPMSETMASHDQKSHFASHFTCLDLNNVSVPLTTLLASCGTNNSASNISDQKSHVTPHFDHLNLRNAMVLLMKPSGKYDTDANPSVIP